MIFCTPSKNILFPDHNHLLTTYWWPFTRWHSGDNQSGGLSVLVVSRWLWPENRTLEVANMVVTWWIVAFFLHTLPLQTLKKIIYHSNSPVSRNHNFSVPWEISWIRQVLHIKQVRSEITWSEIAHIGVYSIYLHVYQWNDNMHLIVLLLYVTCRICIYIYNV